MDEPISPPLEAAYRAEAAALTAELGEPVVWQSGAFVVRGTAVASAAAVRSVASGDGTFMHPREASTLVRVIRRWGGHYAIFYTGRQYRAQRRDGSGADPVSGPDAMQLEQAIEDDYLAAPWPPGEPPVITARTTI